MSPERMFQTTPLIKLGALHFQKVNIICHYHRKCMHYFAKMIDVFSIDF